LRQYSLALNFCFSDGAEMVNRAIDRVADLGELPGYAGFPTGD